eukprot:TRINITY_DN2033_c0_g1_i2.p1 TRINITY_DN2033_c0_g1~~TRINITY_DN2033_c0_g1_i2.p1  ORF type:complete len:260 (-),score=33.96 TRINITY_DN2033_c0_g1_i2:874-1653(-)
MAMMVRTLRLRNFLFLLIFCFRLAEKVTAGTCDLQCQNGGKCTTTAKGVHFCECLLPTALAPDFFRGPLCEQPATMCADTTTFYCANYATCVEVIQGEEYKCANCTAPLGGAHCDSTGKKCAGSGGKRCYNGGLCNFASCICPKAWRGNDNCTLKTPPGIDHLDTHFYASSALVPVRSSVLIGIVFFLGGFVGGLLVLVSLGVKKMNRIIDTPEEKESDPSAEIEMGLREGEKKKYGEGTDEETMRLGADIEEEEDEKA